MHAALMAVDAFDPISDMSKIRRDGNGDTLSNTF